MAGIKTTFSNRVFFSVAFAALLLLVWGVLAVAGCCGNVCQVKDTSELKPQTTCPVMGGKINKEVYADVNGVRVYACCPGCLSKIKAEPAKYVKKIRANGEEPMALAALAAQTCKMCSMPMGSAECKELCAKAKATNEEPTISTPALEVLLGSDVPPVLLDARTGKFDDGRRIPGAHSLSPTADAKEVAALVKSKDALVVTYCANVKCPASAHLAKHLRELGYENVLEYSPGIEVWVAAGNEVEKAEK